MNISRIIFLFVLLLEIQASHAAPVVSISYSHRQTAHLYVNPAIPEGCIIATFSTESAAEVVNPPEGLTIQGENQWQYIFTWDAMEALNLGFTDASAETTTIVAFPEPTAPLDPLQHEIPVIDIRTQTENLWDSGSGLYVFGEHDNCLQYGEDWERPAQFFYFDGSETPLFVEATGLRINGGWSRNYQQKGLRFYFDDYGTSDQVDYDFFGSEPASFQRLIMRSGLDPRRCFTDVLASELFLDLGHLASRSAPVALYLNGEYFGFMTLRERIDNQFIEHTHNLGSEDYSLIKDGQTEHGDSSDFWTFLNECRQPLDFSSHEWFLHAADTFDLVSYIDWLLINIYGATTDNGSSYNSAQFKPADGPWQFITWDEDGLFYYENYHADFFHFFSINSQEEYEQYLPPAVFTGSAEARIQWAAPFRALMQNSEFKKLFADRYRELMDTWFSRSSLTARLAEITGRQESEMARHGDRWNWPASNWYQIEKTQLANWFTFRPNGLNPQFDNFMEDHRAPVELVGFSASYEPESGVMLSWETASEENCAGFILYRGEQPDDLNPLVTWTQDQDLASVGDVWTTANYSWLDTSTFPDRDYYYKLISVDLTGLNTPLEWFVEATTSPKANLFINEFLASNITGIQDETGTCEDWVEIYNQGPGTANLTGHFLTDDLALPTRWEFPDTTLAPGEFLLVWCDYDPEDGPLHTSFKLNAAGETIALMSSLTTGNLVLDAKVFGAQAPDISEGRATDGGETWAKHITPTPGRSNEIISGVSPETRGPRKVPIVESISPNPFNPTTNIRFSLIMAGPVKVDIFSLSGARVRVLSRGDFMSAGTHTMNWNGRDDTGRELASGPYVVRIESQQGQTTAKLLLVK